MKILNLVKKVESIEFIENLLFKNEDDTIKWLQDMWNNNIDNEHVLIGILHVIDYFDKEMKELAYTILPLVLNHKNMEIKEMGVRILENDCCIKNYKILKTIQTDRKWFKEYVDTVLNDFEKELKLHK